jgi:hypothetical protein
MEEVEIKLPKQWKHWCQKAGLRMHGATWTGRNKKYWCYLKGRGFVWRINCFGHFQRGDTHEEFDRWALCQIDQINHIPQSEAEFLNTVELLISKYER